MSPKVDFLFMKICGMCKFINLYIFEHSQKWTPVLFQNDVVLYFELYWKQENVTDINFLVLH